MLVVFHNLGGKENKKAERMKANDETSCHEIQNGCERIQTFDSTNDPSVPDDIPSFLSDKYSQRSIVQLRNRMLNYYTITSQLR